MIDLKRESERVSSIASQIYHLEKTVEEGKEGLKEEEDYYARAQEAQEVLQRVAQAVQQKAHEKIAGVVSTCLSTVFDDPYEFKIEFERKRGKTEARLRFTRRGLEVDPLTAAGGGVVDVAAFALRAACLMLHRPRLTKLLVLDEPFKFVSADYRDNVRKMLEGLAKDLGLQIILVTHIDELESGKIISL